MEIKSIFVNCWIRIEQEETRNNDFKGTLQKHWIII